MRTASSWSPLVLIVLFAAACTGTGPKRGGKDAKTQAAIDASRSTDAEPDVRDLSPRAVPQLCTVRFAYDRDLLDDKARTTLKANAEWLKAHPAMKVQIVGHCDQRGTIAYNLALGQRRASSVRDYYRSLGVAGDRVATISYGKERPLCPEDGESCWQRSRRAETLEVVAVSLAENQP